MGVYLKNKPSSLNYIVSNSILQFLLMGVLSLWLLIPNMLDGLSNQDTGIIELNESANDDEIDQILILLNQENWIDKLSIKHISKEEAISIMQNEIDVNMMDRVKEDNPFRDVITFSTLSDNHLKNNFESLRKRMETQVSIGGIYNLEDAEIPNPSLVSRWSKTLAIPVSALIMLLGYLFLNSSIKSLLDSNHNMINSLSIYGSEPHFIKGIFRKKLLKETFIGWVIAIVLYILAFYLILAAMKVSFSDISIQLMALTVLLPLFLMSFFIYLSINKKINDLFKI